jgi:hypothetical protein
MASYDVSQTRKNAILQHIQAAGLDLRDFVWTEEPSEITQVGLGHDPFTVEALVHQPTGYWFCFDVDDASGSPWAIYLPGRDGVKRREQAGSWDYVFVYVEQWIAFVKQEHEAPDLWAELRRQRELIIGEHVENAPFSPHEVAQIAAQLNETKEYVRAHFELEPGQYEVIASRLEYLEDASQRVGRNDWRNLLIGSFLSLVIQAVLPVEAVQQLLFVVLRGLSKVFDEPGPPTSS